MILCPQGFGKVGSRRINLAKAQSKGWAFLFVQESPGKTAHLQVSYSGMHIFYPACMKIPYARRMVQCMLIALLVCSVGCASILLAGVSGGVAYTITNVAYKTVSFPLAATEVAMRNALRHMGIQETERRNVESGIEIDAAAADLTISISLERITPKTTKISVDARKSLVIKDKATATEIIEQTVAILQSGKFREGDQI